MNRAGAWLNQIAGEAADRLLAWTAAHAGPVEREWLEAMRGELASLDSGLSRLAWALGGPRVAWTFSWRRELLLRLRWSALGMALVVATSMLVLVVSHQGVGVSLGLGLVVVGGLGVTRRARRRPTLLASLVAVGALFAVGASAAGSAAAQTDSQCTTPHAPESAPPPSLVTAQDYLTLGDYDYDRGDCVQAIKDYSGARG